MTDKTPTPRRRARKADGKFKGDNPDTPVNEAWEPVEAEAGLPKEKKYSVKPKVNGMSSDSAGKYGKKEKVRPTFGKVYTITN